MPEDNPCCEDWDEHFDTINSVIVQYQARKQVNLDFETFRYCPWCGAEKDFESAPNDE